MVWVRLVVMAVAATVFAWRLLRVAQREHYVPASVATTLRRWVRVSLLNRAIPVVGVLLVGVAVGVGRRRLSGVGDPGWAALVGVLLMAAWPVGLRGMRGSPPLRWTARVVRLAVLVDLITAAVAVGAWALFEVLFDAGMRGEVAVAFGVVTLPVWVDVALAAAKPIESRLLLKFVRPAEKKLRQLAPDVVAITGSFGKTSVKEHVRDLVGRSRQVTASPASFNNQAGLARTVNDHLEPGTQVLVCEMGTYGRGEIAEMCAWVKPRVAAITRIGPVHLERMGTLEAIRAAKAEIFDGAEVAVVNVDDPMLAELVEPLGAGRRVIRTATASESGADVVVCPDPEGVTVIVSGETVAEGVEVPDGVHPSNVAVALGIAVALGVAVDRRMLDAIGSLLPPSHRLEGAANEAGVVVLDDTFNSNPTGAAAAVAALARSGSGTGRKVVVTPGMVELGTVQDAENRSLGEIVAAAGAELVVVGRVNRAALLAGYDAARPPVVVADRAEAVAWVREQLGPGDAVLYENDLPDHYP